MGALKTGIIIIAVMTFVAITEVLGDLPQPSYPRPSYPPPAPPAYKVQGRPYSYAYGVNDDYHNTKFSAKESSDGNNVQGGYKVLLPDGRLQMVDYVADHNNGFVADVQFKGVATYPAPAPKRSYPPPPPPPSPYSANA